MKTIAAAMLMLLALTTSARADSYSCEVVEIDATKATKPHIDSDIKDLEKVLTKGPFAVYNHFVKLKRTGKAQEVLKSATYALAKGSVTVLIRETATTKKGTQLSFDIGLDDASGTRWLDAKQKAILGKFLLFSRTVSDSESIVYAVGCK